MNQKNIHQEIQSTLQSGIAALKSGQTDHARRLFVQAIRIHPADPTPWVWLSATTDDLVRKRQCLEKALELDPNHKAARIGFARLNGMADQRNEMPPQISEMERHMDTEGRGSKASGMIPFQIEASEAQDIALTWLGKSQLGLEGSKFPIDDFNLKAYYYPYWRFSGQANVSWSCQIMESDGDGNHDWRSHRGQDMWHFENVMVSGLDEVDRKVLDKIEPFEFHYIESYTSEKVSGGTVLENTRNHEMASAIARIKMVSPDDQRVMERIYPNRMKRNVSVQVAEWVWEEHHLLLMPVWEGAYCYSENRYRIFINGQTGKLSGEKPYVSPDLKSLFYILGAVAGVLILVVLVLMFFGIIK
jgi:hypothetical protein